MIGPYLGSSAARGICAALLVALLGACTTVQTTEPGVVGVDRKQRMSPLVSEEELQQGATQAYAQVLAEAKAKNALDRDPQQVARVRNAASRIIAQAPAFRPDAASWNWEVHVLSSDQINAWAMPGGKIAVYTGLLEGLKLTDAELAAVLGHEIAHALREHGRERASEQLGQQVALGVLGAATGAGEGALNLANLALQVTTSLPHSRLQEQEADRIGVELAARAGYDPRAAVTLWQKMGQASQGGPPQFLSTHPSEQNRLRDLEAYSEKVMPLYRSAAR